jgi:glycosyltransferase involved in cell wall biosynthesis
VPLISIITATHAPSADYLVEAVDSIAALQLPSGWELEWIVQEDGDAPCLADRVSHLEFCRYAAAGRQLGIASTRNIALSRAHGVLMQALDHDDMLLPNAFTTLIPHFNAYPIHWAIGQADDLLPDGSRRVYPSPIPFGHMPAGTVNKFAIDHGGNWPIHAAALMMRTASFRALGGWTGIPYDDELATFAALSQAGDGFYEETLTWLYRHHPKQTHRSEAAQALSETGRRVALQRAATIKGIGFSLPPVIGFDQADIDVIVSPVNKDTSL